MKIAFCLGSMDYGGAQRVIANLSNYFVKENDTFIITTKHKKSAYKLHKNIHYYTIDKQHLKETQLKRTIRRLYILIKILKKEKPDIIISFQPEPTFRILMLKKLLSAKIIISIRNDPNKEYSNLKRRVLAKILYPLADGIIFQTPEAQHWFSKRIQDKSIVIPNPINEAFLREPYVGHRDKTIISIGRLVEQKNQKMLIDAFAIFYNRHKDFTLKIYGDGPLRQKLQDRINTFKLGDKIKLMGETSTVSDELYKASMFILTSNYEGMPNALMEAMALGTPCISTNFSGGAATLLIQDKKNGLIVSTNDTKTLSSQMERLVSNTKLANNISKQSSMSMRKYRQSTIEKKWNDYIISIMKQA